MTDRDLAELVYEVIGEIGPVKWQRVAEVTFEGEQECEECGRPTAEFEDHQGRVKSMVLELSDKNKIYPNAEWEYRQK